MTIVGNNVTRESITVVSVDGTTQDDMHRDLGRKKPSDWSQMCELSEWPTNENLRRVASMRRLTE